VQLHGAVLPSGRVTLLGQFVETNTHPILPSPSGIHTNMHSQFVQSIGSIVVVVVAQGS
jgi:hypothetical protein